MTLDCVKRAAVCGVQEVDSAVAVHCHQLGLLLTDPVSPG